MFACAERVTAFSWSLLISYRQQNLLVHEILDPKPGCNNGQSQILPSYWNSELRMHHEVSLRLWWEDMVEQKSLFTHW